MDANEKPTDVAILRVYRIIRYFIPNFQRYSFPFLIFRPSVFAFLWSPCWTLTKKSNSLVWDNSPNDGLRDAKRLCARHPFNSAAIRPAVS